jgi:phospholipase/lecithinase/hemolysin
MKTVSSRLLFLLSIRNILLTLLLSASGIALANNAHPYSGIYAFGTSLSDEGNAFIACGNQSVPPYENLTDNLNTAPGDAPYAIGGHHFSNGSTWVDVLAKSLRVKNSALPVFQNPVGTNYAQAGTTAFPEGTPFPLGPLPCRVSFGTQIQAAIDRGGIPGDALVTVEIGSNDVINAVLFFVGAIIEGGIDPPMANAVIKATVLKPAADLTTLGINTLIAGGASTLLLANVPDIGVTPAMGILDAQLQVFGFPPGLITSTATDFAETYNENVQANLQPAIDGGTIVKFDLFTILQEIVYGGKGDFNNVTAACITPNQPPFVCMKPDSHLFWDGIHPTKATHDFFAQEAMDALGVQ